MLGDACVDKGSNIVRPAESGPKLPSLKDMKFFGNEIWSRGGGGGAWGTRLVFQSSILLAATLLFLVKGRPSAAALLLLLGVIALRWKPEDPGHPLPAASPREWRAWTLAGFAALLANLRLLEWRIPYYFTQDDNLSQFLPVMLRGARSMADGVFPTWNPYQLLGSPTASVGTYALTYPLTYASWALAALAGNENATIEVFCALHLAGGFLAMVLLGRTAGFRPSVSVLAGLAYSLGGYFLVVGRSWYYVTPTALWMPLLLVQLLRWIKGPAGLRWVLTTGLIIGLYFHSGNAQLWCYGLMYWGLLALLALGRGLVPWRRFASFAAASLAGIGLALPLAGVQALETAAAFRWKDGTGISLFQVFGSMLVPQPLEEHIRDLSHRGVGPGSHLLYHSSPILAALAVAGVLMIVLHPRRRAGHAPLLLWIPMGLLGLWLAWGDRGGLWSLMAKLPVFCDFKLPQKHFVFAHLFLLMTGSVLLTQWLGRRKRPLRAELAIVLVSTGLLGWQAGQCRASFYTYDIKPYPALPADLAVLHGGARSVSLCRERGPTPLFHDTLMLNFPTAAGLPSLSGYDPLVSLAQPYDEVRRRMNVPGGLGDQLDTWGVRWVLFDRGQTVPPGLPTNRIATLRVIHPDVPGSEGGLRLAELRSHAPLAFMQEHPAEARPVRFDESGAEVALDGRGGNLVVSVLHRKWLRAEVDGRPVPCAPDEMLRCTLAAPAGSRVARVSYRPPWLPFTAAGVLSLAAGIWVHRRFPPLREAATC